jgi:hypothetical protein
MGIGEVHEIGAHRLDPITESGELRGSRKGEVRARSNAPLSRGKEMDTVDADLCGEHAEDAKVGGEEVEAAMVVEADDVIGRL